VTGGRIAAIGRKLGAAKETVKADGLALAPGIIDGHTHYDAQITWDPFVDPSPALGVTTAVLGNCGFTIAPCKPQDRDLTMRHLTHVEGMSLDALRAGIRWGFESFPQYLDMLAEQGVGPNVACYRRPFGDPHLRDGRAGDRARRDRRRDRADGGAGARGDGGGGSRLRLVDRGGAQRRGRHADAVAPGRRQGGACPGACDGRKRARASTC
jgi:N-acyl-D-aspartate/D-glutamate deacylase